MSEKNYFIADIGNKPKRSLRYHKVPFFDNFEIDGQVGIMIGSDQIERALRVCRFAIESSSETSIPGIMKAQLKRDFGAVRPGKMDSLVEVHFLAGNEYDAEEMQAINNLKLWFKENHPDLIVNLYLDLEPHDQEVYKLPGLHLIVGDTVTDADGNEETFLRDADIDDQTTIQCESTRRIITFQSTGNLSCSEQDYGLQYVINMLTKLIPVAMATEPEEGDALLKTLRLDRVRVEGWAGQRSSACFHPVMRSFAHKIGQLVKLSIAGGATVQPTEQDMLEGFTIYVCSAIEGKRLAVPPTMLWGTEVGVRSEKMFSPTFRDDARVIVDDCGWPVAEVIGNHSLFIFHYACYRSTENEVTIFSRILDAAAEILTAPVTTEGQEVVVSAWNGEHQWSPKTMTAQLMPLATILQRDMIVHDCTLGAPPKVWDAFQVYLGRAALGKAAPKEASSLFGRALNGITVYGYAGFGLPIRDPQSGLVVAELCDNELFVLFPLQTYSRSGEWLLQEIVAATLMVLQQNETQRAILLEQERQRFKEEGRKAYVELCARRLEVSKKEKETELAQLKAEITELQQKLITASRKADEANLDLQGRASGQERFVQEFNREFESLMTADGVEYVWIEGKKLCILTKHIYITPPKRTETYDIGKFRVEIDSDGGDGGVKFFNLTRQGKGGYNGYNVHHPHVNSSGSPCLGNISAMVPQLLARYQFSILAQIAINYLESVNWENDHAGSEIFKCWPKVEPTKTIEEIVA